MSTMKVGIDAIGFYIPHYYLDLATLAKTRNVPVDKFYIGLGQKKMSIPPLWQLTVRNVF